MRKFGIVASVLGLLILIYAFSMKTTVTYISGMGRFGKEDFNPKVESVHNIGLMQKRQSLIMVGGLAIVVGVILVGFSTNNARSKNEATKENSDSADTIMAANEKKEDRYIGTRDVNIGGYQLFLTKKYEIVKNSTLDKFVIGSDLFDNLDSALKHADNIETQSIRNEFSRAYQVKSVNAGSFANIAGIIAGDTVFSRDGKSITSDIDFQRSSNGPLDEKSKLVIFRNEEIIEFDVSHGRLGINGEWITLNSKAVDARLNYTH